MGQNDPVWGGFGGGSKITQRPLWGGSFGGDLGGFGPREGPRLDFDQFWGGFGDPWAGGRSEGGSEMTQKNGQKSIFFDFFSFAIF